VCVTGGANAKPQAQYQWYKSVYLAHVAFFILQVKGLRLEDITLHGKNMANLNCELEHPSPAK
jgi:hypothetical protein